jgi:glutaryl-CoA dehydrogenase
MSVITPPRQELRPGDFLALDERLDDTEREIRDLVARFARERVLPHIEDWYARGHFPVELAEELGGLGLLGMHLSGYGAAGATATAYGVACRELEAIDSGLRSFVSVQGSLAMFPIWRYGSEEQKERWLPRMARGEVIGCFGLTEADFGSDPAGMRTRARRDGDDWILNGSKMWITNGGIADVAVVWVQTEDGVRGFIVGSDLPGFTTADIKHKHSLRASVTSELVFDDCRLPAAAELPGAHGLRAPLSCLTEARFGIVWGAVGAAGTCFEAALEHAKTRIQFGKPIGAFQLTQKKLADMLCDLTGASLLAHRLAELKDADRLRFEQVSLGKLSNVRTALAIAREARTILGASGISAEYPVMRHMANLESVLTYEGTSEIHSLMLGEALTGLRAIG